MTDQPTGLVQTGKVVSVNTSPRKTVRKTPVERCYVIENQGLEGDAHGGDWHRQVSLLALESIETMRDKGLDVGPGDFAENITTEGIDLLALPVGSTIEIGEGLAMEVTQIGKVCHTRCAIYYQAGDCVMPKEGIFAVVKKGGDVAVGDEIRATAVSAAPEPAASDAAADSPADPAPAS
jgi:MOSC domain-containing protein YiiM